MPNIANLDASGRYQFVFANIAPNKIGVSVEAALYATYNGKVVLCQYISYSVKDYCYSMLSKYGDNASYGKLNTLLVDLLYYGASAQLYTDYKCNALVTEELTADQIAWKTDTTPVLTNRLNREYQTVLNAKVTWTGAGLVLQDSVCVRFKLAADSIQNLSVVIETEDGIWLTVPSSSFEKTNGGYYVYFNNLNAGQMRKMIYATVYDGKTAVSHTLAYSIESYAASKTNGNSGVLVDLMYAMMQYGDSAAKYAGIA